MSRITPGSDPHWCTGLHRRVGRRRSHGAREGGSLRAARNWRAGGTVAGRSAALL